MKVIGRDKYKTLIALDGINFFPVTLVKQPIVTGSREKDMFDYIPKSSEWKFVRYENAGVFDAMALLVATPSTVTDIIRCKIELWDDWETLTGIVYEGSITIGSLTVSLDDGFIKFTPTTTSGYEWYEENKSVKHDIYSEVPGYTQATSYHIGTETEEYYIPFGSSYTAATGFNSETATIDAWSASKIYVSGWHENSWARYDAKLWHCIVDNGPTATPPSGTNPDWEQIFDPGTGHYINIVYRIFREVCDLPFYHAGHTYIQGNNIYERDFPIVSETNPEASNCDSNRFYSPAAISTETGDMILCGSITASNTTVSTGYSHLLSAVFTHMLAGSGLTVESKILSDATNPVTLQDPNPTMNLRLVHNRVIKGIHDYATKGEMTLQELLADLCSTFQLQWYIDVPNSKLVIEHILFFKNGKSYSGLPALYADLTDQVEYPLRYQIINDLDGQKSDREFSFDGADAPEIETFHFPDGYDYDGQIKYSSAFAKKGSKEEHTINNFMTDFAWCFYQREQSADDMYSLIAADYSGMILRRQAGLRWKPGSVYLNNVYAKLETKYPNGDLMWDNLLRDYWTYYAYFLVMRVNGEYTAEIVTTQKKIKKQRDIRFPRLKAGLFDPQGLIRTNLGDGEVQSYELDTDTDFVKVTLIYES